MPVLTYLEAIRQGISEEMERDPLSFALAKTSAFTEARSRSPKALSIASVLNA